jgi:hypothetical protein
MIVTKRSLFSKQNTVQSLLIRHTTVKCSPIKSIRKLRIISDAKSLINAKLICSLDRDNSPSLQLAEQNKHPAIPATPHHEAP